jgi:hypothetical protein
VEESLKEAHKSQNTRRDLLESVRKVQSYGMEVMASAPRTLVNERFIPANDAALVSSAVADERTATNSPFALPRLDSSV